MITKLNRCQHHYHYRIKKIEVGILFEVVIKIGQSIQKGQKHREQLGQNLDLSQHTGKVRGAEPGGMPVGTKFQL